MASTAKFEGQNRRERHRIQRETKLLIKGDKRFSEVASLVNMTRDGVYFHAFGDYQRGMTLQIWLPYDPSKPTMDPPQHAEVVRTHDIEGSLKKGVAVKLLNLFLKP